MERLVRPVVYGFTQITVELHSWHWLTHTRTHAGTRKFLLIDLLHSCNWFISAASLKADDCWLRTRDCVYAACASHACTWQPLPIEYDVSVRVCGVWCIVAVDLPHLTLTTLTSCVVARAMQFALIQFDLICFAFALSARNALELFCRLSHCGCKIASDTFRLVRGLCKSIGAISLQ